MRLRVMSLPGTRLVTRVSQSPTIAREPRPAARPGEDVPLAVDAALPLPRRAVLSGPAEEAEERVIPYWLPAMQAEE